MIPEDVVIRPARIQDVDTLTRFSAAMALETERRALDPLRLRQGTLAVLEEPHHGSFYVAELRNDHLVVGQLLITYEWSDWRNAQFWWIQSVYVDPGWRRRGVYRAMHTAILAAARARTDVCGIRLYVEQNNATAQQAYRHAGMHRSPYLVFEDDFVSSSKPFKEQV
ncbi:MAG: GNAT family N-acetyltransferase [Nitrospiraceae bacterium]